MKYKKVFTYILA